MFYWFVSICSKTTTETTFSIQRKQHPNSPIDITTLILWFPLYFPSARPHSMAAIVTVTGALRSLSIYSPVLPTSASVPSTFRIPQFSHGRQRRRRTGGYLKVMARQQQQLQGASAIYAKEMERLSAKESLLLAFTDSGGFDAMVNGKVTEMQRIDVNERIVGLERLNPTPRPTTSPFLEGRWNFEWFGAGTPGLLSAKVLFQQMPSTFAKLSALNMLINDGYSKVSANLKFLNTIEVNVCLSTKLSIEGPIRMKEEYVEGVFETPSVSDESIPEQLKGTWQQAADTLQQLPSSIKDVLENGLKIPLNGSFERLFLISYLDEEILIVRDASGAPDVFTRLEALPEEDSDGMPVPDYNS